LRHAPAASALRDLADHAARGTLTLVFSSHDGERNNAVVLRDVLEQMVRRSAPHARRTRTHALERVIRRGSCDVRGCRCRQPCVLLDASIGEHRRAEAMRKQRSKDGERAACRCAQRVSRIRARAMGGCQRTAVERRFRWLTAESPCVRKYGVLRA
jgi:hypothetical protein